jgi:hypothetical protein
LIGYDVDPSAEIVRIGLISGKPVEIVAGRRFVVGMRVEIAEQLVEGPVLQHQLDDVIYLFKVVGHARPLFLKVA